VQPQPRAQPPGAEAARRLRELAEDERLVVGRDTRPRVTHLHAQAVAHARDAHGHARPVRARHRLCLRAPSFPPFFPLPSSSSSSSAASCPVAVHGELHGVAHEVHQHVLPQPPVAGDDEPRRALQLELEARLALAPVHAEARVRQLPQVHLLAQLLVGAALHLGQVPAVLHDVHEHSCTAGGVGQQAHKRVGALETRRGHVCAGACERALADLLLEARMALEARLAAPLAQAVQEEGDGGQRRLDLVAEQRGQHLLLRDELLLGTRLGDGAARLPLDQPAGQPR